MTKNMKQSDVSQPTPTKAPTAQRDVDNAMFSLGVNLVYGCSINHEYGILPATKYLVNRKTGAKLVL